MRVLPVVVLALVLAAMPMSANAYVLMGEHVLDLMVKALGHADTLKVTQTVTLNAADIPLVPATLPETVRIRFPYDFRADGAGDGYQRQMLMSGGRVLMAVNGVPQDGPPPGYARYADILMVKPRPALADHLRTMGIDVSVSSLGRLEDDYCYVVGARFPDENAAQLWVAKDTFLPMRLMLPPAAMSTGEGTVEIRYRNWTFVDGLAYPMHIVLWQNHQIKEEIRVDRLQVNPVFSSDLFDLSALRQAWSRPAAVPNEPAPYLPEGNVPGVTESEKKN
jgi:hypothetical protein